MTCAERKVKTFALECVPELFLHAIIDWAKSRLRFSLACDQVLYFVCKLVWVALIVLV